MKGARRSWFFLLAMVLLPMVAQAHVGSKDVFEEATAGPYKLFVTIRVPNVIPGIATVEVRTSGAAVQGIDITPVPMSGEASQHPPAPDAMKVSDEDKAFFTGSVWMMESGSWEIRFTVAGAGGAHKVSIPVPASSLTMKPMSEGLALLLAVFGLVLVCGMAGIIAAATREARLEPGLSPTPSLRRRGMAAMAVSLLCMLGVIWGGGRWWHVEAALHASLLYRQPEVHAVLRGNMLQIRVGSIHSDMVYRTRPNDDFILDHGKIMHLYVVREPELDAIYHLHPRLVGAGDFRLDLPQMPPGEYRLYGDVVHANGFPETLVATIKVPPGMHGRPFEADDAEGAPAPLSAGLLGTSYKLPDGYTMVWDKPASLTANTAYAFHFELLDPEGKPPAHMRTYLGMAGHAAFLKTDGTVFAHVHPSGSAAMAAMMMANNESSPLGGAPGGMGGMAMPEADLSSNAVEFPYGFPSAGRYRIFVQMKHDSTVETGTFDAVVK
jgi:hypothetical protein